MRLLNLLLALFVLACSALGQKEKEKEKLSEVKEYVVVTASIIPALKAEAARSVVVIDREEIKNLPVSSVEELLKYVCGLDFQQRGASGLQIDPSLRAGTFEQTLILINGIKMIDPQTGHNSLNVPFSIEEVERVEILKGPGSRLFGPNAFSGAINIITRIEPGKAINLSLKGGQHGYREVMARAGTGSSLLNSSINFTHSRSDGYIENTDFTKYGFHQQLKYNHNLNSLTFQAGYSEKSFGANGFYSPSYPYQWEKIKLFFAAIEANVFPKKLIIKPKIYYRYGYDEFLLDRQRPSFYRNVHHNFVFGSEITGSYLSRFGQTSAGVEWRSENVDSSRLGQRTRKTTGMFVEHRVKLSPFILLAGAVAYYYPGYGWKIFPGIELSYQSIPNLSQFFSLNQSFRLPSFTELYYNDPVNRGNSQLKPEEAKEIETGIRYTNKLVELESCFFVRKAYNLIDWVRWPTEVFWRTENITELRTRGWEISLSTGQALTRHLFILDNLKISYANYNSDPKTKEYLSKYAFSGLRQQLIIRPCLKKILGLKISLIGRYIQRHHQQGVWLIEGKISWVGKNVEAFLEGTNLTNKFYYEAGFIPAPGRWLLAGFKVKIGSSHLNE